MQTKVTLQKYMDSMLQKSGKVRGLIKELRTKYSKCDSTEESLGLLQVTSQAPRLLFD